VIAVVDAAGWPIVVKRPDNAKPTSVEIAINKAFTAACHRRPTHTYTNAQPGQEAFGIRTRTSICDLRWLADEVDGGGRWIGVPGGHTREDIACCRGDCRRTSREPVDFTGDSCAARPDGRLRTPCSKSQLVTPPPCVRWRHIRAP
jgi:uncharacterized protein GlcG (DUF336 family)